MTGALRPCLECGELSPDSRCPECSRDRRRVKERETYQRQGRRDRQAGHDDARWRRLSRQARRLQPWCSDCRLTETELKALGQRLEADHLPSAWAKYENRKPIILNDIEVVCGPCNVKRGSSRPGSERYIKWEVGNNDGNSTVED